MEIEKISKQKLTCIRHFKSLNNKDEIIEYANNNLDLIYPFTSPVKPNFCIYRTRPKKNIKSDEDISSPSTFSYVPIELNIKKIPLIGRFNLDGQSIFYASISASTNLKEMKDDIKEGDVVYISKWIFKEDANIRLYYIYPPEHLKPKSLQDSLLANIVDNHKINQTTGDFFKELGYMLLEDNTNKNVYLKTALIANNIYKFDNQGISYDAILYPSVQGHEYDFNLAIKPQYVDGNLLLQCVYKAIVKDNKVKIDCSQIGINIDNHIQWYELFINEDNIVLEGFYFLDENKTVYQDIEIYNIFIKNKEYSILNISEILRNNTNSIYEHLNRIGFFKEEFALEDSIDYICRKRCKFYDVKLENAYFYESNIRYVVSFIRLRVNYANSLKSI